MIVALATCAEHPALWIDDAPLVAALARRGVAVSTPVWDDPGVDWPAYDVVVIRSTWDYVPRRDEFVRWAASVGARLRNPPEVVRWNTDKTYLRTLAGRGVPVVPTEWLAPGEPVDLAVLGWPEVVVKPAISAGSRQTGRFLASDQAAAQALADTISGTVMVQPYLTSVEDHGERSLMFFGGEFSHAVRRTPSLGFEGTVGAAEPARATAEEVAFAERALDAAVPGAAGRPLLYARVDLVRDATDALNLIELELVEPQLFLRFHPEPAERLADLIANCGGGSQL